MGGAPFVVFSSGSLKDANCVVLLSGVRKECLASQKRTPTLPEMLGENKASHSPELKVLTYWEEPTCWYKGARTGGKQRFRVLSDAERGDALWRPTSTGPQSEGSGAEEPRQGQGRQTPLFCDLLVAVLIIIIRVQAHTAVGKGLTSRALTEYPLACKPWMDTFATPLGTLHSFRTDLCAFYFIFSNHNLPQLYSTHVNHDRTDERKDNLSLLSKIDR